ncbi:MULTISPECIES: ABC transporter permease [unclassified Streptomyces]|uniref:ABC transporter permease n=1 Tax=unclassified Streptomyces TaxID=2593676 RepID=UPI002443647C|nr:ABC transporter permease [Streptomyces sp. DH41]MDG9726525.1 ABC transporter permease [Streptomyces sp. DH41]
MTTLTSEKTPRTEEREATATGGPNAPAASGSTGSARSAGAGRREEPAKREAAWLIVAAREIAVKIRDRGFLLSTVATLAVILGAVGLQVYLASTAGKITVAAVASEGDVLVRQAEALADQADQDVEISVREEASADAVREAVRAGDVDAGLLRTPEGWALLGDTGNDSTAATWLGAAVQSSAMEANATSAGTDMEALTKGATLQHTLLSPDETPESVVRMATYFFGFLFYLAAVLLGVSLATSIVEEKQNRIVEIIASSIRLRDLLVGKIVGSTTLALAQMVAFTAAAAIGLVATGETGTLGQVTAGLGWFLVYYVVGIAVLACVFAAAGAIATRTEDIQSTTTPVNALVAVVFVVGITVTGTVQSVLSFVPLTSTITMPARIIAGDTAWWEPAASLIVSLAAAALIVLASERVYRRALMQTGRKLSFRQALRLED